MPSEKAIRRWHQKIPSENAIRRCHQKRPSEDAIRRDHQKMPNRRDYQKMPSEEVIRRGHQKDHQKMPSEEAIRRGHQACLPGVVHKVEDAPSALEERRVVVGFHALLGAQQREARAPVQLLHAAAARRDAARSWLLLLHRVQRCV